MAMSGAPLHHHWHTAIQAGRDPACSGEVVFEHSGPMEHTDVDRCVGLAEAFSMERNDPKAVRKRLVNVLVEALENLSRHVEDKDRETTFARLGRLSGSYVLVVGNALPAAVAAVLLSRVEILNDMDEDHLKQHYMGLLKNEGRTANGGAGLGLVTMVRRSRRPVVARSYAISEQQALLVMELAMDIDLGAGE